MALDQPGAVTAAVMPTALGDPPARYAHAVLTTGATRWLHTSGVVPRAADGAVPPGIPDQARLIWANIAAILDEVGMAPADVVSVTTYVVAGEPATGLAQAMAERDAFLGGRAVASTLVTVPALAQPSWLLEIAVIAAS